jgi:hypothetical protein
MTELAPTKAATLRMLIERAPNSVLFRLEQSLATQATYDDAMAAVWRMMDQEVRDRAVRDIVLAPVVGLFQGPGAMFPTSALGALWRFLTATFPADVAGAVSMTQVWDPDTLNVEPFDRLCNLAAEALARTEGEQTFTALDAAAAAKLSGFLTLAPIVRRYVAVLPDWVARMGPEQRVAARLGYRDCSVLSADAGLQYFQMLASLLPEPDQILRVISAVMDRPGERYMAETELSSFGARLLDQIDACIAEIKDYKSQGGIAAGRAAGRWVRKAMVTIAELDSGIQLNKDGAWGQRLGQQKRNLAATVEVHLREIEKAVGKALPVQAIRYSARLSGSAPKIADPPDSSELTRALSLLAFADEIRSDADSGGFGSTRTRVLDSVEKHTEPYIADLLELMRNSDPESCRLIRAFVESAAEILSLVQDEKSAELVRRRLAVA